METVEHILTLLWKVLFFFVLSLIFLPAFLIVNYTQKLWSDMFNELF